MWYKMVIVPKVTCRVNAISIILNPQNSNDILYRNRKNNLNIHMEAQRPQIAKAILSKKRNVVDTTIPDFKL
jgi:hypothetical protein